MTQRGLLSWLDEPGEERGIRFATRDGGWTTWSYGRLARLARRAASGLAGLGIRRNDSVLLVQRSGPEFVAALYGAMRAGAIPTAAAPPAAFQDRFRYDEHLVHLVASTRPRLVVTDPDLLGRVGEVAASAGARRTAALADVVADADGDAPARPTADLAIVQFTSGSTGRARGIRVPFDALTANVEAIRRWLRMRAEDAVASWLPVHHDMGLTGCLLAPITAGSDLWLMEPADFVRSPLRYLRCLGVLGARLTAMPGFGLDYAVRRVRPDHLEGMDFSHVRAVIVGAERIAGESLERFLALLAPRGLRRTALLPAYGLAEATLAVTGVALDEGWRSAEVEPGSLSPGRRVEPGRGRVVGCGRPLAGASVAIVDGRGQPLPDGHVGVIEVDGPSVAAGYLGDGDSASLTAFRDGRVSTGDAGFVHEGQLFVLGRLGDSVKLRAGTLFAEDLEATLVAAGMPAQHLAVVLGVHLGSPTAVAVLEQPREPWPDVAWDLLRRRCEGGRVVVVSARRGAISRTSSGKPRRRVIWQAFVDGALGD